MTIQRERLNRKNASGSYDTIHLETQADLVLMTSDPSKNVEQVLGETVTIAKGGTGGTTAAAGLYNLMAGLTEMTAEELAEDDLLCVLDVDANSAKIVALSVVGNGGGGTPEEPVTNPNWPKLSDLVVGNTINWAGHDWIVSHVTSTEAYLTLFGLPGESTWYNLQDSCNSFGNLFNEDQKACLKTIIAGNTSGKVFVATRDQMDGGFSYFNSDIRRYVGDIYWTSTEYSSVYAWYVDSYGNLSNFDYDVDKSYPYGFRPSVCVDMTLYDSSSSGGSEEPVTNPNRPNKPDLVVGNTINWAGNRWIVAHITDTEVYLITENIVDVTDSRWDDACAGLYDMHFTEEMRTVLKPVYANTEYIWIPSYAQLSGGFDYFNSASRRACGYAYHTCTYIPPNNTSHYIVTADGSFDRIQNLVNDKDGNSGLRPIICIDLTTYS